MKVSAQKSTYATAYKAIDAQGHLPVHLKSKQGVPQKLQRRLNKQVGNVAEVKIAVKSLKNGKTEHFKWLDSEGNEWLTMLMNKIMEEETIYAIDERPNTQRSSLLVYEEKRNTGEISKNS